MNRSSVVVLGLVSLIASPIASGAGFGGADIMGSFSTLPSINLNSRDGLDTSLRIAAREGRLPEAQRLLQQGADPNGSGEWGETALMYAARYSHPKVAEALVKNGARVDARDSKDDTALMKSSMNCSDRVASVLLRASADPNLVNQENRSALHIATHNGCVRVVKLLLATRNLSLNTQDNQGKTALDYALLEAQTEVGGPYTEIANSLFKAGAKAATFTVIPALGTKDAEKPTRPLP